MIPQGNELQENIRPDWLISSNGERLELDFFIPSLSLAIEVQGNQHFEFVEFFHQDKNGYEAQLNRDRVKESTCKNVGVKLVKVFDEKDIDELILTLQYPKVHPLDYTTEPLKSFNKDGSPKLTLELIAQRQVNKSRKIKEKIAAKKEFMTRVFEIPPLAKEIASEVSNDNDEYLKDLKEKISIRVKAVEVLIPSLKRSDKKLEVQKRKQLIITIQNIEKLLNKLNDYESK